MAKKRTRRTVATKTPSRAAARETKSSAISKLGQKPNIILILTDQQRSIQWFPPGWEKANLPAMTFCSVSAEVGQSAS